MPGHFPIKTPIIADNPYTHMTEHKPNLNQNITHMTEIHFDPLPNLNQNITNMTEIYFDPLPNPLTHFAQLLSRGF
ncbi:hypothetical protein Hanom_Chr13g01215931 [Helianthus anomalus]